MSKTMLIDAAHPEETRVVVLNGQSVDDFDFESKARQQIRGNIYLAKVTRVEPSLQASFVEYGGNRHGFLAFGEIHPDYYQIPAEDRAALLAEEAAEHSDDEDAPEDDEVSRARRAARRNYKIQEVIRRRQIMLVQAVKEERGNKGAALTTYLSLAGRYCVLMPNTPRGGGISRKITAAGDRKRLKSVVSDLHVPQGMGLIIRTAGAKRTKTEIKRDYEYLLRLWDDIRDRTLKSIAPSQIHEEDNLVKRAVRDLYDKTVEAVLVEGDGAYREAKDFVKMLMPSHAKKVQHYKSSTPLFARMKVERQLSSIHDEVVQLKSGGYIVINQTEALVAIDVNSGKSTRERSIESTALKTNLEAADEAARQMRLRDLAGLIVIDFIDMEESRNDRAVEKRLKDALRHDRARVQTGKISGFGLMEISRQRRRTGVLEGSSHICPTCSGTGRVRSPDSTALQALREVETATGGKRDCEVVLTAETQTALYILNEKRRYLADIEADRGLVVRIVADSTLRPGGYSFEITNPGEDLDEPVFTPTLVKSVDADEPDEELDEIEADAETDADADGDAGEGEAQARDGRRRRRRRRGGSREDGAGAPAAAEGEAEGSSDGDADSEDDDGEGGETTGAEPRDGDDSQGGRRRRRRGRRGGRRRREGEAAVAGEDGAAGDETDTGDGDSDGADAEAAPAAVVAPDLTEGPLAVVDTTVEPEALPVSDEKPARRRRPPRRRKDADEVVATEGAAPAAAVEDVAAPVEAEAVEAVDAVAADAEAPAEVEAVAQAVAEPAPEPEPAPAPAPAPAAEVEDPNQPRRTGWWARNAKRLFGE